MSEKEDSSSGVGDRIRTADAGKLDRCMRVMNIINALFLTTAGVLTFVFNNPPSLLQTLSSLYVIAFSQVLLCFETRFRCVDGIVKADCGFMFRWQGRLLFFLFVGTLAFGLDAIGIAAGAFTAANVIFNVYVLCTNKNYSNFVRKQQQDQRQRKKSTNEIITSVGTTVATTVIQQQLSEQSTPAEHRVDVGSPAWEKILDEESGSYYYYNPKTKETRWDVSDLQPS